MDLIEQYQQLKDAGLLSILSPVSPVNIVALGMTPSDTNATPVQPTQITLSQKQFDPSTGNPINDRTISFDIADLQNRLAEHQAIVSGLTQLLADAGIGQALQSATIL